MTQERQGQTVSPFTHYERNRRILVVDDHPSIHRDFEKILGKREPTGQELHALTNALFGLQTQSEPLDPGYEITSAYQGDEAVGKILSAEKDQRPFALAFMDINMPPGLDGVVTAHQILSESPFIQIVLVSAYSEYSWEDLFKRFGETQRLLFLSKPFDTTVIKQLALVLTCRWSMDALSRTMVREITASGDSPEAKAKYLQDLLMANKLPYDKS